MKDWRNWILVLLAMLISAAAGEVIVRTFWGTQIVLYPRYQAAVTYRDFTIRRLQPESTFWHTSVDGSWKFTINRQGFRDRRDFSYQKSDGAIRILALGDSHTQGFEVRQERTYAAVLESFLDRRNLTSEVINTGVSGFGTAEAAVFLEQEGLRYDPDAVVLAFYANDFADNVKSGLFALNKDGDLVVNNKYHAPGASVLKLHNSILPLRWLSENSYLYSLMMNAIWDTAKMALHRQKMQELAVATEEADHYQKRLVARLLQRMHLVCKQNDVRFIVVDIPQFTDSGEIESSIPDDLLKDFQRHSDALVRSEKVLSPYRGAAEFHVPHGQHHISEMTHMLLGVEIGQAVQDLLGPVSGPTGGGTAFLKGTPAHHETSYR